LPGSRFEEERKPGNVVPPQDLVRFFDVPFLADLWSDSIERQTRIRRRGRSCSTGSLNRWNSAHPDPAFQKRPLIRPRVGPDQAARGLDGQL